MAPRTSQRETEYPAWVPPTAAHYIEHTERGRAIRDLARSQDVHPSTILRQIRRWETRRDDPLIDGALRRLAEGAADADRADSAEIDQVLRALTVPGAVLVIAREMATGLVVRAGPGGETIRDCTVPRGMAEVMAMQDWITSPDPAARLARYTITNVGRDICRQRLARAENRAVSGAEDGAATPRLILQESPLEGLYRRRDKDGQRFLSRDLVRAGERLHEDYEIADLGAYAPETLLLHLDHPQVDPPRSASGARAAEVFFAALRDLGPELAAVALRACCLMEGMEKLEAHMGWAARSGKIVLRIALQRLARFYAAQGDDAQLIG